MKQSNWTGAHTDKLICCCQWWKVDDKFQIWLISGLLLHSFSLYLFSCIVSHCSLTWCHSNNFIRITLAHCTLMAQANPYLNYSVGAAVWNYFTLFISSVRCGTCDWLICYRFQNGRFCVLFAFVSVVCS